MADVSVELANSRKMTQPSRSNAASCDGSSPPERPTIADVLARRLFGLTTTPTRRARGVRVVGLLAAGGAGAGLVFRV
jgi:hypothetical protein